jgi:hypothetical protein
MREQQSISWSNHAQVPASARWFAIQLIAIKRSVQPCSRPTELIGRFPSIATRARRNVIEPVSLHRFVSPEIY